MNNNVGEKIECWKKEEWKEAGKCLESIGKKENLRITMPTTGTGLDKLCCKNIQFSKAHIKKQAFSFERSPCKKNKQFHTISIIFWKTNNNGNSQSYTMFSLLFYWIFY